LNQLAQEYGGNVLADVKAMDRSRFANPSGRTEIERLSEELRASESRASASTGKDLGWNQQMEGYRRYRLIDGCQRLR